MKQSNTQTLRYIDERQAIVQLCLDLSHSGFLAGVGGNIALRLSETEFAVTPSAADYYSMGPEDICLLDLRTLERIDSDNSHVPSVEKGMHAALLLRRPDLKASVHTHQPLASTAALLHRPIPLNSDDQKLLGREVALVEYGPSGSSLLVRALKKALRSDVNAYLLRNHGLICAAPTLQAGLEGVQRIEKAAAAYMLSLIQKNESGAFPAELLLHTQNLLEQALTA